MKLEKEFVLYPEALELKQLGFDEPCICGYSKSTEQLQTYSRFLVTSDSFTVDAPTFSQAFRWFREKHGLFIQPNRRIDSEATWYYFLIETKRFDVCEGSFVYEEAELACLRKLMQIVKNK